ncbi:MAG: hypothetical protein ACAH59_07250 [Pseudobdellovibrionaceae bacterium]
MFKMKFQLIYFLFACFLSACSTSGNKTEVIPKDQAQVQAPGAIAPSSSEQAAMALDRNIVSTIAFEPGRKGLSPEATAEINKALMAAKKQGEVAAVDVAVWSDQALPKAEGAKLSTEQIELAEERGENIEKYIDRMEPNADVNVHNMAEKPNAFANFLNTQDSTVKNRLAAVDDSSRNSSAMVFIKLK